MGERSWHPIMLVREYRPGQWAVVDSFERAFALIDIVRISGEVGYKVTTCALEPSDRKVIGYYTTLWKSAEHVYGLWVGRNTPHGPPNNGSPWPSRNDPWG